MQQPHLAYARERSHRKLAWSSGSVASFSARLYCFTASFHCAHGVRQSSLRASTGTSTTNFTAGYTATGYNCADATEKHFNPTWSREKQNCRPVRQSHHAARHKMLCLDLDDLHVRALRSLHSNWLCCRCAHARGTCPTLEPQAHSQQLLAHINQQYLAVSTDRCSTGASIKKIAVLHAPMHPWLQAIYARRRALPSGAYRVPSSKSQGQS